MKTEQQGMLLFAIGSLVYFGANSIAVMHNSLLIALPLTAVYISFLAWIGQHFFQSKIIKIKNYVKNLDAKTLSDDPELDFINQKITQFNQQTLSQKAEASQLLEQTKSRLTEENMQLKQAMAEQKLLENKKVDDSDYLDKQSKYDDVTALPNRMFFNEILSKALSFSKRRGKIIAVLLINIDNYRQIQTEVSEQNSHYILKEITTRFKNCLRTEDMLAKVDSDEFVVLLNDLPQSKFAATVAEKMLAVIKHPMVLEGKTLTLSASIGIASTPSDGENLEELLKNANNALFKAKRFSRGGYQYNTDAFNMQAHEHIKLEAALKTALEMNQLSLHFQPKYKVKTGSIAGVEALMRWEHPEYGLISPTQFIPLAEETGLITKMTEWAIQESCRIIKTWLDSGYQHVTVAIKLSPKQFLLPNLVKMLEKSIKYYLIHPQYLELEIIDNMIMDGSSRNKEILNELKEIGCLISIDHFGKGVTSISYLKEYPFHALKIDRAFIQGIPNSPNDTAITNAIIALAHQLGILVVAEGVETAEQVEFLTAHDCDLLQGYFLSHPLPAKKLEPQLVKLKDEVF